MNFTFFTQRLNAWDSGHFRANLADSLYRYHISQESRGKVSDSWKLSKFYFTQFLFKNTRSLTILGHFRAIWILQMEFYWFWSNISTRQKLSRNENFSKLSKSLELLKGYEKFIVWKVWKWVPNPHLSGLLAGGLSSDMKKLQTSRLTWHNSTHGWNGKFELTSLSLEIHV